MMARSSSVSFASIFLVSLLIASVYAKELDVVGKTDIVAGALNGPYAFTRPEGQRFFYMYVPSSYVSERALPLIIYFHGFSGNWSQGIDLDQPIDAEANEYVLALPAGTPSTDGGLLGWNAGACCLFNTSTLVDDVMFTRIMLKTISGLVNVSSFYAMGWSNGGMMTERLACEAADLFDGAAADASAVVLNGNATVDGLTVCDNAFGNSHINYIHFHATADIVVPWIGSSGVPGFPSALEDMSRWVRRNGCDDLPMQTFNDHKNFTNLLWPKCRSNTFVDFMSVTFAGHWWWSKRNSGFSTADYIMKAFTQARNGQRPAKLARV